MHAHHVVSAIDDRRLCRRAARGRTLILAADATDERNP